MHGTHRVNSGVAFLWRDNEPAPQATGLGSTVSPASPDVVHFCVKILQNRHGV